MISVPQGVGLFDFSSPDFNELFELLQLPVPKRRRTWCVLEVKDALDKLRVSALCVLVFCACVGIVSC